MDDQIAMEKLGHTLARQDADMSALRAEVGSVKADVKQIFGLFGDTQATLITINSKLDAQTIAQDKQPGILRIVGMFVAGGTLAGMAAAAVGSIVSGQVLPAVTELHGAISQLQDKAKTQDAQDQADLQRLKAMRASEVTDALKALKSDVEELKIQNGWQPAVRKSGS